MDGVVHPNVEQAIGRDRIRKAFKRYENRPADEHRYGIVRSVNEDGSYEVLLDGDVQTSRCAQYGTALVGDRVLAVTKKDGRNDLIGRLGGEIGGGGTVDPDIEERFEGIEEKFEGIEADIDLLKTNKLLWSGEWYMKETNQTVVFPEPVSAQPNGIVLVWSWYSTNTWKANDTDFQFHFIPKGWVAAHGSGSSNFINCPLVGHSSGNASNHAAKKLFITDNTMVGTDTNTTNQSANYVLREVWGV